LHARTKGRRLGAVVAVVACSALLGMGGFALLFSSWSDLIETIPQEAAEAFATAIERAGGPPAYLQIDTQGHVQVNRTLESEHPTKLRTLHLIAWDPRQERLLRVAFPFWFVRVKMSDRINLGTITSALSQDWDNLNLKVSVEELQLRGPGLVLDHSRSTGMRVLLWSEAAEAP